MRDNALSANGNQLVGAAYKLCADLALARPAIYWSDLLATALVAYASLACVVLLPWVPARFLAGTLCVLAIYRGISFIHEVTHLRKGDVPGFTIGYNVLIGVPFLVPSLLYEGVHNLHHAKSRYGTAADPEYLPLARQSVWHIAAFVVVSALAPLALLLRFAVLTPLAAVLPRFRPVLVGRCSALAINPEFRREKPSGAQLRSWLVLEAACCAWALAFVAATVAGWISVSTSLAVLAIGSGVAVLNQIRTLAAHHWENEGEEMSATEQFLDSVNVPPPATLPVLWAPVGLRYHALHHLLPRLPYHNLGKAHARLCRMLPGNSPYHGASNRDLASVLARLLAESRRNTASLRGDADRSATPRPSTTV